MNSTVSKTGKVVPALTVLAHRVSRTFLNCPHKGRKNLRSAPPTPPCWFQKELRPRPPTDPVQAFFSPEPLSWKEEVGEGGGRGGTGPEGCDWLPLD